ncbi:MAG TPA: hypothetical protein VGB17_07665 [Pyrinomonadaceae bacterium]
MLKLSNMPVSETTARFVQLTVGAFAIAVIIYWLQFSTQSVCCGDFDGYYHIRWSRLLWEGIKGGKFPPRFTWLPLTTLNPKDYVDHHLLFHIIQIPFTWFGDLRLGAKISATLFASLAIFSCYWMVVRYRISYALVWLVALLACSAPFLYRINMTKAPPMTIIFMICGIYLLFERKYIWLLPLAFVFTLAYDLSVLLGAAAIIWAAIIGWSEHRIEWRPVLWVMLGILAGFIINPYFPHNLVLFYEHLLMKVRPKDFPTAVGQEWYPYDTWEFLANCLVACIAMVTGYIAFHGGNRKRAQHPLFFLAFSTVLLILNLRWKRIAEYWPPFAVLFAAFALQPVFDGVRSSIGRLPADVLDELQPYLDREEKEDASRARETEAGWKTIAAAVAALLLGGVLYYNVYRTAGDIASSAKPPYYQHGMEWVRENVPAGQMIYNTDWDDFPRLFYFDPSHAYVSGLDPNYLLDQNKELSELYDKINLGKVKDPAPVIRDRFGARYVFTDNDKVHDEFYNNALDSGWFELVYEDEDCAILHIRDEKGEPPETGDQNGSDDDDTDAQQDDGNEEPQ